MTVDVLAVLQGSYGVVKLAYNEDDEKHYVSWWAHFFRTLMFLSD